MNLDKAIYNHLRGITELTTEIPEESLHWIDADTDAPFPMIVYKCVTDPPLYGSDRKWQRWQFSVIHKDKWKAEEIGNILKINLNNLRGNMGGLSVSNISIAANQDPVKRADGLYQKDQDYRITIN